MIPVTVAPGDTLSGIAANHDVSLSSVEAANPQIENPNLIYAGEQVLVPSGGSYSSWAPSADSSPAPSSSVTYSPSSSSSTSSDLADVPGVPHAFAACVAQRESSDNPSAINSVPGYIGNGGGAYGIMAYTWHSLGYSGEPYNAPVSEQKAAFTTLYTEDGTQPWSPSDHC